MSNAFVHIELNTNDVAAAKKFYRGLFDWKLNDMQMGPGMVYTMIDVGQGMGGGLQKNQMPDLGASWLSYVAVPSVKKTIAKAAKRGANVLVDYRPIPGMGAYGIFVDPTGAPLGVFESSAPAVAATAKKSAAKKPAAKKLAAKKPAAKKAAAKQPAAKKATAKKVVKVPARARAARAKRTGAGA